MGKCIEKGKLIMYETLQLCVKRRPRTNVSMCTLYFPNVMQDTVINADSKFKHFSPFTYLEGYLIVAL